MGERPGDRDDLLGGRAQGADASARIDRPVAEALEQRRRLVAHPLEVEERPATRLVGEEDALGDGQLLDQVELLVDRRHPAARGSPAGSPSGSGSPRDDDLARGRLDRAGDALDQGRLAGAVGPEQAVDLALEHLEVDALERPHARVLLDQPADLEHLGRGRRRHRHQRTTSGRRLRWAISSPASTFSGAAAPDRVLVLDREHAVEAALVERVDVAPPSRPRRAPGSETATSPCPRDRTRGSRCGRRSRSGCARPGTSRRPWRGRGSRGRRTGAAPRPGRSRSRAGARGRS